MKDKAPVALDFLTTIAIARIKEDESEIAPYVFCVWYTYELKIQRIIPCSKNQHCYTWRR